MDVAADVYAKRDFLLAAELGDGPFSTGALNALGDAEKVDFVDFFAALYHYCTLSHDQLLAFTFSLTDASKSGRLSLDELTTLVRASSFALFYHRSFFTIATFCIFLR